MDNKDKIEKTLSSLDGIKRAQANPFLFEKIVNRMQAKPKTVTYGTGYVMAAMMAILAVFVINFAVWKSYIDSTAHYNNSITTVTNRKQDISSFAKEFFNSSSSYNY